MNEVRYMISDAAKLLKVEAHALRYWEEELELQIPRNEMGHRYYREEEIKMLEKIRNLKDKGYQLRTIKMEIEKMKAEVREKEGKETEIGEEKATRLKTGGLSVIRGGSLQTEEDAAEKKLQQFREIMGEIVEQAIRKNNQELSGAVGERVSESVLKEMDYLARDRESRDEERFKRLDTVIREIQKSRQEAAAAQMEKEQKQKKKEDRKKGLFRR